MPWAKIDDGLHASEKFAAVSLAATGLWTLCLSWTTDKLKDGFVPSAMVRRFAGADADALAAELVEAGLWEIEAGGWRIHAYLEYNPPAEKVLAEREAARERMSKRRSPEVPPNKPRSSPSPVPGPVYTESSLPPARESAAVDDVVRPPKPTEAPRSMAPVEPDPIPVPHDPAQARLMAAFRSERFPDQIADQCPPGELAAARQHLAALVANGATTAQVRQATAAAIRRHGKERVTVQSVVRHWSALLEPDAPPPDTPPPGPPGGRIVPAGLRPRLSKAEEIQAINREAAAAAVRHGIARPSGMERSAPVPGATLASTPGERP